MFRSISTNRVWDDDYQSIYNQSPTSKGVAPVLKALSLEANELPEHEQSMLSETPSKKEKARNKFSQKAVHIIPLVLLFCALFLWIFSNPDVELPMRNDAAKLQANARKIERDDATSRSQVTDTIDTGIHNHDNHEFASTMTNHGL